jgi:hypothetical protein
VLVSIEHPANGLDWARLYDNRLSGWRGDDAGTIEPEPVIIGSLPLPAINTSPVLSPQLGFLATPGAQVAGVLFNPAVLLPPPLHQWRGSFDEFLTLLATNNGVHRRLEGRFGISSAAYNSFLRCGCQAKLRPAPTVGWAVGGPSQRRR